MKFFLKFLKNVLIIYFIYSRIKNYYFTLLYLFEQRQVPSLSGSSLYRASLCDKSDVSQIYE